ncbi:hypothetical protein B0H15DRAFT_157181 [Mycena belliarum]|uniref:Uncharacterized protein n=1 Tax=Mycena belliarum TaxID=1033014 RepID=A0AAD6XUD5_9AGAR|nr:hypothetical protein B0H15DRAFT_157181 [Mycena belliae]
MGDTRTGFRESSRAPSSFDVGPLLAEVLARSIVAGAWNAAVALGLPVLPGGKWLRGRVLSPMGARGGTAGDLLGVASARCRGRTCGWWEHALRTAPATSLPPDPPPAQRADSGCDVVGMRRRGGGHGVASAPPCSCHRAPRILFMDAMSFDRALGLPRRTPRNSKGGGRDLASPIGSGVFTALPGLLSCLQPPGSRPSFQYSCPAPSTSTGQMKLKILRKWSRVAVVERARVC